MQNNWGNLQKIHIAGFKSINQLELSLNPINIIVGANGVGKSNFLDVFDFLHAIEAKHLQSFIHKNGGADRFLHFGPKITQSIKLQLDFSSQSYKCDLVFATGNKLIFKKEEAPTSITPFGSEESCLSFATHPFLTSLFKGFNKYHFHDTSKESALKKMAKINDCAQLRGNGENLAAMLYRFKTTPDYLYHYNRIISIIQMIAPFFQDFILQPNENGYIPLAWQHKNNDAYFDVFDFSDGTLRFIALTTLLAQPDELMPSTLIIDEPELGLHPYALKIIAELMQSLSKKGTQIIATSQSTSFINAFTYADIIIAEHINNTPLFHRLSHEQVKNWITDFALGELWEKNILGGMPNDF